MFHTLFKYGDTPCKLFGFVYILRSKEATCLSHLYLTSMVEEGTEEWNIFLISKDLFTPASWKLSSDITGEWDRDWTAGGLRPLFMSGEIPLPLNFTAGRARMQSPKSLTMFCFGSQERLNGHRCDREVKEGKYLHRCLVFPLKDSSQNDHKKICL